MPIIAPILSTERRLMQKTIHKTRDKNHARMTDRHADAAPGETRAAMSPERSVAPVPPLGAGLTDSRYMALKVWYPRDQAVNVTGPSNRFVRCWFSL